MLDQFALKIPEDDIISDTQLKTADRGQSVCLWCNEEELNNYMDNLYAKRNGKLFLQDGEYVHIFESDVDNLLNLWKTGQLHASDPSNMEKSLKYLKNVTHSDDAIFYGCSF
jgi:hypothetical protein